MQARVSVSDQPKQRPAHATPPHCETPSSELPREHVLVHQDPAPLNMILDSGGRLWLVDWGHSSFYPAFMEYLEMEEPERAMPCGEQTLREVQVVGWPRLHASRATNWDSRRKEKAKRVVRAR
ncbi:hypothetical protein BKA82DRAFT_29566 [Pisolithus tinctorius]|uniref:Uncharacterized protein n=1 Tax=Pisolithus tinctorius Marx 270 TaxID=870435 RepID=A0A0C3JSH5_PISTI|nr:hypothetical protein BKA82DRAFT_29566 [Pisolithus tinctorius]KIO00422.1 hypothetical protein M404DRAFT_29566 [Pisolithus tinctorius Marx 270]